MKSITKPTLRIIIPAYNADVLATTTSNVKAGSCAQPKTYQHGNARSNVGDHSKDVVDVDEDDDQEEIDDKKEDDKDLIDNDDGSLNEDDDDDDELDDEQLITESKREHNHSGTLYT